MGHSFLAPLVGFSFLSLCILGVTGCGTGPLSSGSSGPVAAAAIHGSAHGGQSPLSGSAIYLYAASTSGYGTAATSLLKTTSQGVAMDGSGNGYVLTDANGTFTITSDYSCPSATTPVYMIALGGNPGLTGTVNNTGIAEMAALGPCGDLTPSRFIIINELSTVAAVSALGPFLSLNGSVATSSTNVAGLTNAFTTASNLAGVSPTSANTTVPGGYGAVPFQQMHALANILASCVNTSASTSTNCSTLFTATTSPDGTVPVNTMQAMLNINRYPAQNVAALFALVMPDAPFQPSGPRPNDWTLSIVYTTPNVTNGLNGPNYLALDSKSNVWSVGGGHAVQFSNAGALNYALAEGNTSYLDSNNFNQVLAVDLSDNLWVDDNSYSVTKINADGTFYCSEPLYCLQPGDGTNTGSIFGGQNYIVGFGGIAIDPSNVIWAGSSQNYPSAVVAVSPSGIGLGYYRGGGLDNTNSIAIDVHGNIWAANNGGSAGSPNTITEVSPSGVFLSGATGFTSAATKTPTALAFDRGGNLWIANSVDGGGLSKLDANGSPAGGPYLGGGMVFPEDIAIDGDGNVWVSSFDASGLAEFSSGGVPLSPSAGYFAGNGTELGSVAIDSSGNVWASSWDGNSINEVVGVAAPTVVPVALATKNKTLGTRP